MDEKKPKKRKMQVIPTSMLETQEEEAYFREYFKIMEEYETNKAAWEYFEKIRSHYGLIPRYSTFESFKVSKGNYVRRLSEKADTGPQKPLKRPNSPKK